jgi:hypothetical protein
MRLTPGLTWVDEKSSEVSAVQELLKLLDMEGEELSSK